MPPKKSNLNNANTREARRKRVERAHQLPEQVDTRNTAQRIRTAEDSVGRQERGSSFNVSLPGSNNRIDLEIVSNEHTRSSGTAAKFSWIFFTLSPIFIEVKVPTRKSSFEGQYKRNKTYVTYIE
ncbi:hypothetical protein C0J52_24438 [Blattella germanica]|nr:hypothetical protein C0J52_24438 [Blattella germanica]